MSHAPDTYIASHTKRVYVGDVKLEKEKAIYVGT